MTYATALTALADPTRRALLERLRAGPLPVGVLADGLPVSRPAVSQHLKVLDEAGLVAVRRDGTRRLYGLRADGLMELRAWLDGFWDGVLTAYGEALNDDRNDHRDPAADRPAPDDGA